MSARVERSTYLAMGLLSAIFLITIGTAGAIGQPIQAPRSEGDLVIIGRDEVVESPVAGVQILGGSLRVDSRIEGDLVAIGSSVSFGPEGSVGRHLVALGGSVSGLERSRVGGDLWAPRSSISTISGKNEGDALIAMMNDPFSAAAAAIKLAFTLFWILISIPIVLIAGREVRATSVEAQSSLLHAFLVGLVAFTSFVLTAVVFSYLIPYGVGVLLLGILAAFAIVTKVYGMVAIFHAVGYAIAGGRVRDESARIRGDLAFTVIGAVLLGVLRLVPWIGNVLWITASLIGVGVALATWFGRRQPWFLAVRTGEIRS
ncbi:MAG TPA: hypothetical protein VM557_12955 [Thermoanaerobaculia bacterium]|nr:hypothetical protein [Thermoanaerobaculia bacterium]